MSIKIIEQSEKTPCVLCGVRLCYEKGYGPEYGICCTCAGGIATLHWEVHSGEEAPRGCRAERRGKPPVSQAVKFLVLRRDGLKCAQCGDESRPLHIDHIIPRSKGGGNEPENLQPLCDLCNLRKGSK